MEGSFTAALAAARGRLETDALAAILKTPDGKKIWNKIQSDEVALLKRWAEDPAAEKIWGRIREKLREPDDENMIFKILSMKRDAAVWDNLCSRNARLRQSLERALKKEKREFKKAVTDGDYRTSERKIAQRPRCARHRRGHQLYGRGWGVRVGL
jgi:hypothetical protein